MSTVNLFQQSSPAQFEGDYQGELPKQLATATAKNPAVRDEDQFRVTGAAAPNLRPGNLKTQGQWPSRGSQLAQTKELPVTVLKSATRPDEKPLLNRLSVAKAAVGRGRPGKWSTVSTYRGWLVQKLITPWGRPMYRAAWGDETTDPQQDPSRVHIDVDRTSNRPRIQAVRNIVEKGKPDKFRAKGAGAWQAWSRRLDQAKTNWGPAGHVETFHGVKIFRGKRNITSPDGTKVTVPFYYTKQRLQVAKGTAPAAGKVALGSMVGGLGSEIALTASTVEAETLNDIKALVESHPLAADEKPAKEGPGPAAILETRKVLPGEAGTKPEAPVGPNGTTSMKTTTKAALGIGAAAVAALMLLK